MVFGVEELNVCISFIIFISFDINIQDGRRF